MFMMSYNARHASQGELLRKAQPVDERKIRADAKVKFAHEGKTHNYRKLLLTG